MRGVGCREYGLPGCQHGVGLAEVDHRRRQQPQPPVVMLEVLPVDERAAEVQSVLEAAKAVGELRPVLQRLELALRVRVIVADVRPAVRLGDSQRRQQLGYGLRTHRRATVAVERQLLPGRCPV